MSQTAGRTSQHQLPKRPSIVTPSRESWALPRQTQDSTYPYREAKEGWGYPASNPSLRLVIRQKVGFKFLVLIKENVVTDFEKQWHQEKCGKSLHKSCQAPCFPWRRKLTKRRCSSHAVPTVSFLLSIHVSMLCSSTHKVQIDSSLGTWSDCRIWRKGEGNIISLSYTNLHPPHFFSMLFLCFLFPSMIYITEPCVSSHYEYELLAYSII